jgi:ribosomal protein S18 acetylase RimI-like enzyme
VDAAIVHDGNEPWRGEDYDGTMAGGHLVALFAAMGIAFRAGVSTVRAMKLVRWKRFTWELAKLPPADAHLPGHFVVRPAAKEDAKAVREVIFSAFSLDAAWSDTLKTFSGRLEAQLEGAFARPDPTALVVTHGQRVIAASLLTYDPDADNHLLSGPCVLAEYRNRGLGTALLHKSLEYLQEAGLTSALAVCKEMAPASKFVYRKFGSTSLPYNYDPALVELR